MKLSTRRQRQSHPQLSMTSMIDVVFLLLVFFLVTTTFVRPEQQLNAAIKVNETDSSQSMSDLEPAVIEITKVNNTVLFKLGAVTSDDILDLKNTLEAFDNKAEGAFVRVAGNVSFDHAAQAMGLCRSTGFASVSYVAIK